MSRVLPILFNTEMVRAILDGRKMVTRRVIKPQPQMRICYAFAGYGHGKWHYPDKDAWKYWGEKFKRPDNMENDELKRTWVPPYHTDDILYVRETWNYGYIETSDIPEKRNIWFEELNPKSIYGEYMRTLSRYFYKADENAPGKDIGMIWHPSIHMPKEAARIWLKVTDVRVERLRDITDEQAKKEGFSCRNEFLQTFLKIYPECTEDSWLWVIEFERCGKPESEG